MDPSSLSGRKSPGPAFRYGGQAVIEGVMIRGRSVVSLAVRHPGGSLSLHIRGLSSFLTGPLRRVPLVRGTVVLVETMLLGVRALTFSANVALEEEEQELSSWALTGLLMVSFTFGLGLFFVVPVLVVHAFDHWISNSLVSNLAEGVLRLVILVGYVTAIGRMADVRRVFAYHGAEHMAVHAHEAGDHLLVNDVRRYSTAHPRCGTAFLLVVMIVAILVFALLGDLPLSLLLASRVILLPVIAGISYEIIRFSGAHSQAPLMQFVTAPSLALQALTTRKPKDEEIEVALCALWGAQKADDGDLRYGTTAWTKCSLDGFAPHHDVSGATDSVQ